jgi:OmpR family two-component system bacitracin resistance response regulator BceR
VPLKGFFSRKEYNVLKLLLEQKEKIVSRDAVGATLWPINTEKHYSDWAIDQLIARLRQRLTELSLPPKMIQSVRGKGYKLSII